MKPVTPIADEKSERVEAAVFVDFRTAFLHRQKVGGRMWHTTGKTVDEAWVIASTEHQATQALVEHEGGLVEAVSREAQHRMVCDLLSANPKEDHE